MSNFFLFFQLDFFPKETMQKLSFNYFLFSLIIIIIFLVSTSNFTKERIYEYTWSYFVYNLRYVYIYLYILYKKSFSGLS